jgi:hypothetical protein
MGTVRKTTILSVSMIGIMVTPNISNRRYGGAEFAGRNRKVAFINQ